MAQRTIVQLEDDLDGGSADETVIFGLDGHAYEIDLSALNAVQFRDALAKYIPAARRVSNRPGRRVGRVNGQGTAGDAEQTRAIRAWAVENGYEVGRRGRIPAEVKQAFLSAQS
jgi:hypothetical protein